MSLRLILAFAAVLLLAGCGKNASPSPTPVPPPAPRNEPVHFLYFGVAPRPGRQIEDTADHVDCILSMDWGDWDTADGRNAIASRIIDELFVAHAHGIRKAIVATGFCTFTSKRVYRGPGELATFRRRIDEAGLLPMVVGCYPLDEPDLPLPVAVPDSVMMQCFNETRGAWPGAKIFVTYGDHGTPGASAADVLATDRYELGSGVLSRLPALMPGQQWQLAVAGSDPWRTDPLAFRTFADAHPEVWGIMAFVYFDRTDEQGVFRQGIGSNGMLPAFKTIA
jgi:hypothetical protein